MTTTIETVFAKGVFRPLQPVSIPENLPVRIHFDDQMTDDRNESDHPRLQPREYPENDLELSDSDYEYVAVPPKAIHAVKANVIFAAKLRPVPYPDEE